MKILVTAIFFSILLTGLSQNGSVFLNNYHNRQVDKVINASGEIIHTGFKPLLKDQVGGKIDIDSVLFPDNRDSALLSKIRHTWFLRKLRKEDFFLVDKKDFKLGANFLVNLESGRDTAIDYTPTINTRGICVYGKVGRNVYFYSDFFENQGIFREHINAYVRKYHVIPGFGRTKSYEDKFDYSSSSGFVTYFPWKILSLQLGHGKHFVGEGYRSLLLSDNSFFYPYLKITTTLKKIQYINLFTSFQEVIAYDNNYLVHSRKTGSFNYLSYAINKYAQVGLFEGVIFQVADSAFNKKVPANSFNPVIGVRSLQYSLDNTHNVLLGLNLKIIPHKSLQLYAQYVIDDMGKDSLDKKNGLQAGIKIFDPFGFKNFYLQAEYNKVNPYTYSHLTARQNYSFYNQALAHPLGANFREFLIISQYNFKDFFIEFRLMNVETGLDSANLNYGQNIFLSNNYQMPATAGYEFMQGLKTSITSTGIKFGYMLNPRTNMHFFFGYDKRLSSNETGKTYSNYIYFGFKTQIYNSSFDF
ncbi:MAG: hypothetical protein A2W91_16665 [Bacteroidetes bacterium GWF2_38_335]|nr:MAG: hypothetical protein A2W91_16665 [Bacteroidetes bacterium GWF2_38_335]OFY81320.1 MAG: hypothetical protein A2281_07640 [Bacteroidetes bacterium RIFOXYA12_FULL_38_20]HBS85441.1 hypothetical protein [Bacteroidales bacterium]